MLESGTLPPRTPGNVSDLTCRGLKPPVPEVGPNQGQGRYAAFPARVPLPLL